MTAYYTFYPQYASYNQCSAANPYQNQPSSLIYNKSSTQPNHSSTNSLNLFTSVLRVSIGHWPLRWFAVVVRDHHFSNYIWNKSEQKKSYLNFEPKKNLSFRGFIGRVGFKYNQNTYIQIRYLYINTHTYIFNTTSNIYAIMTSISPDWFILSFGRMHLQIESN